MCARTCTRSWKRKGVKVIANASPTRIEKIGDRLKVHLSNGESASGDKVLFATGREPNTQGLGLEKAGVKLNDKGAVAVNENSQIQRAAYLRGW